MHEVCHPSGLKPHLSKVSALGPHLVHLGFSDVCTLLRLLQLMLHLPELGKVNTGLLLLHKSLRFSYQTIVTTA